MALDLPAQLPPGSCMKNFHKLRRLFADPSYGGRLKVLLMGGPVHTGKRTTLRLACQHACGLNFCLKEVNAGADMDYFKDEAFDV